MKTLLKTGGCVDSTVSGTSEMPKATFNEEINALYQQLERIYGPWQANVLMQRYVEGWNVAAA